MSTVGFFEHCLKTAEMEYMKVISKPTLSRGYTNNYKNLIKKLETAVQYNEITTDEYINFKAKLKDLDYEAYKERMKKAGM